MNFKSGASDLVRGMLRDWKKMLTVAFVTFSALFTIVSAIDFFFDKLGIKNPYVLGLITVASLMYGARTVWKPSKVALPIANCATCLEIAFDDLFAQDGIRAIAVNDFFDSKIGKPVSPRSLHGLLITQCFGGHPQPFDHQLISELSPYHPVTVPQKVDGKNAKYEIGTTAMVNANTDQYLLFALTHSDPITCKARADVTMLWNAVNALWKRARIECNGLPLNVPLVGSGPSGLGLPTRDLLNLIILSAITETKAHEITKQIRIILHRDRFDDIDLRDVKAYWKDK